VQPPRRSPHGSTNRALRSRRGGKLSALWLRRRRAAAAAPARSGRPRPPSTRSPSQPPMTAVPPRVVPRYEPHETSGTSRLRAYTEAVADLQHPNAPAPATAPAPAPAPAPATASEPSPPRPRLRPRRRPRPRPPPLPLPQHFYTFSHSRHMPNSRISAKATSGR